MPAIVDISNKRTPNKSSGKPSGSRRPPKAGVLIGLGVAAALAVLFLVWYFLLRGGASSKVIAPYEPTGRTAPRGPAGGATGGGGNNGGRSRGTNVPRGLPGDGG